MKTSDSKPRIALDAYQSGLNLMVILNGRLVLENCESVRTRLHGLLNPKVDKYYLYMGNLEYVDSAGWGTMVGLKMAANRNRTKLCFLAPTDRIMDIFRISKLDSIFEIKRGPEAEAVRSSLELPEFVIWRETPEIGAGRLNTEANFTPISMERPTPMGDGSAGREKKKDVENLSRDAVEHLRQGDYQKVINAYLKILDIEPEDLSALNNLGVVYEKKAEWYKLAVQTWQRVLEVSERRSDAKHSARAKRHLESLERLTLD